MVWDPGAVTFEFREDGLSGDHVVTVRITTPDGVVHLMAEVEETEGGGLRLSGLHIHSDNGKNTLGRSRLRQLAQWALRETGYDEIVVEGAARTSGANPGRVPGRLRFTPDPVLKPEPGAGGGSDGAGDAGPG